MAMPKQLKKRDYPGKRDVPAGLLTTAIGMLADFLVLRERQADVNLVAFADCFFLHDDAQPAYPFPSTPAMFDMFQAMLDDGHGQLATRLEFLDVGLVLLCGTEGTFSAGAHGIRPDVALKVRSG